MYKDKDKQREVDRERQRRRRDKIKAKGVTESGRDKQGVTTEGMIKLTEAEVAEAKAVETNAIAGAIEDMANDFCVPSPKRGKDIKCFADLPPDVRETINMMSQRAGKIDPIVKAKRTAAAIKYQHLFPDRYKPTGAVCTGIVTGKPGDEDCIFLDEGDWRRGTECPSTKLEITKNGQ